MAANMAAKSLNITFQLRFLLNFWPCTIFKIYFTPDKLGCYNVA